MNKMPERIYLTDFGYECESRRTRIGQSYPDNDPESDCVLYIRSDAAYPERCGDNSTRCVNIAVTKEAAREALEAIGSISYNRDCNPCPPLSMHKTIKTLLEAAAR